GKLDRKALPAPPEGPTGAYVPPRTAVEEVVAEVWASVLGVSRVGAHDDFFALGGHSLLAVQALARAGRALGVSLSLRSMFEAPTVAAWAKRAAAARQERHEPPPRIERRQTGETELSFAQQRLWFLDQLERGSARYNVPVALRLEGALDVG